MGYYGGKGKLRKSWSHALRKYFASTLENAGMPKAKVDYLLGHHRSGNDLAYFRVDIDVMKKLYIDYLEFLTFEKVVHIHTIKTEDEKRLKEIESQHKELIARYDKVEDFLQTLIKGLHMKGINDQSFEEYFRWKDGWREDKKSKKD